MESVNTTACGREDEVRRGAGVFGARTEKRWEKKAACVPRRQRPLPAGGFGVVVHVVDPSVRQHPLLPAAPTGGDNAHAWRRF